MTRGRASFWGVSYTALGAAGIGGGGTPIVTLIPNPVPEAQHLTGADRTAVIDTTSEAHYIQYVVPASDWYPHMNLSYTDANNYAWFWVNADGRVTLHVKKAGVDLNVYDNFSDPNRKPLVFGETVVRGSKADGFYRVFIDDVELTTLARAVDYGNLAGLPAGTKVQFDSDPSGALPDEVIVGAGNLPLFVTDQTYDTVTRYLDLDIYYIGAPTGYLYELEGNGVKMSATVLANPEKGRATIRLSGIPAGYVGPLSYTLYQKNDETITTTGSYEIPAASKLGMNMTAGASYTANRMYSNMLAAGDWQDKTDYSFVPESSPYLNANGEAIGTSSAGFVTGIQRPYTSGVEITLSYNAADTGTAYLVDDGTFTATSKTSWTTVGGRKVMKFIYNFDPSVVIGSLQLHINGKVTGLDCRETTRDINERITEEWYTAHEGITVARFLDFMNANNLSTRYPTWAERKTPAHFHPLQGIGIPVEDVIAISDRLGADVWCPLPPFPATDYIVGWITALNNGLAPGRVAYMESANEWDNTRFPLYHNSITYCLANGRCTEAQATDFGGIAAQHIEHVYQHHRMADAIDALGAPLGRFVKVIASLNTDTATTGDLLANYGLIASKVDALAVAPYFGHALMESPGNPYGNYTEDLNVLFPRLTAQMNAIMDQALTARAIAKSRGWRFIMYEGQQHYVQGDPVSESNPTGTPLEYYNPTFYRAFQTDARMKTVILAYLTRWINEFGDLAVMFNANGPISARSGAWGFREDMLAARSANPKWDAFLTALELLLS